MKRFTSLAAFGIMISIVVLTNSVALAQPGSPPPPPPPPNGGPYSAPPPYHAAQPEFRRQGFIIGFSLGAGTMVPDCDGCDSLNGVAFDVHLGGMVNPRLAIMWDGSGIGKTENDATLVNAINVAAVQYFVSPTLWLKGGLGFGRLSISDSNGDEVLASDTAPAVLLAAGVEVMHSRTFALDLSLRVATVSYDRLNLTNAALNLGFNWY